MVVQPEAEIERPIEQKLHFAARFQTQPWDAEVETDAGALVKRSAAAELEIPVEEQIGDIEAGVIDIACELDVVNADVAILVQVKQQIQTALIAE